MIDKTTADRIKAAADIVEVIGEFIPLKKSGRSYVGLCPFHDDHSPSLRVYPTTGRYKCYACGEGGSVVTFLMMHQQMNYPGALRWLASRYGIEIVEDREFLPHDQWKAGLDKKAMYAVNELVATYYAEALTTADDGAGIKYLRERGISDEMIAKFHLGYAPTKSEVLGVVKDMEPGMKYLFCPDTDVTFKSGKTLHVDNGVGVVYQNDTTGGFVDRYAGRLVFPWHTIAGQVVAFGGRTLLSPEEQKARSVGKYVNSPESLVYHKSQELYGLYQAKGAILREDCVFLVEGYFDLLTMHQAGVENVVSNSGTALSDAQVALLRRWTDNIVLLYDADPAGEKAIIRGIEICTQGGMNAYVVMLPEGEDPDSFFRHHPVDYCKEYLATHRKDFVMTLNEMMLQSAPTLAAKAKAVELVLSCISQVENDILRELYIKELAEVSALETDFLKTKLESCQE